MHVSLKNELRKHTCAQPACIIIPMQSTMLLAAAPAPPAWLALEAQLCTALSSSGIRGARKLLHDKHLQPEALQPPQLPGEHVRQGWARQEGGESQCLRHWCQAGARQPRTLT